MVSDITFVFVLYIGIAGCTYYETADVSSWNETAEKCDLATPDLMFKSGEYRADIKDEDWNGQAQVWIGYFMAVQRFDYIGCLKIGGKKADFVKQFNTPGICHSACKSTDVIGVHDNECFCLLNENFVNVTQPYCDTICEAQKGIVCGGDQHMSVYKIGNEPDIGHDEETEKSCLGLEYQQVSKIFKWQQCSEYLRPLCAYIDSETNTDDKHYPWEAASNECFKRQTIPTSYETAEQFKTVLTGIYWTGTIRNQGIYSRGLRKTHAQDLYGYLTKNGKNMTFVMFTKENKKLKGLCQIDDSGHKKSEGSVPVEEIGIGAAVSVLILVIIISVGVYKWKNGCLTMSMKQQSREDQIPTGVGGEVFGAKYTKL